MERTAAIAVRQFGNATWLKDQSRDQWGWSWLETLLGDMRFGARLIRAHPGLTVIAVLTLALGIGANVAVFSLVDAVVLHPLPYPEPDRLFMLWTVEAKSLRAHHSSYGDFEDWRRQSRVFEGMAAYHGIGFNVSGLPDAEHVFGIAATPELLGVLGVQPALGRLIAPADGPRVAVITHRLWVERYGSHRAVIGKSICLDGHDYAVLAVLPASFHFQPRLEREPDVFVPMEAVPGRSSWFLRVVGRLRRGADARQAQAEMDSIGQRIAAAHPECWSARSSASRTSISSAASCCFATRRGAGTG